MDYVTKPTSRKDIRKYAKLMRKVFGVSPGGRFPVLEVLERISDVFPGSRYEVLDDCKLPPKTMAECRPDMETGSYVIYIKESVYYGAYESRNGACLGFICHEICHIFLFAIGFTPIYSRSFEQNQIRAFESVEWQAKALCGEVMIPYEESLGMNRQEIVSKYKVSKAFAEIRVKMDKPK